MTATDQTDPDLVTESSVVAGRYAGEWALFADWCAATDRTPLPAHPDTIHAFLAACPAAPDTYARRLTAIEAAHRADGHEPPARTWSIRDLARGRPAHPGRVPFDPGQVDAALRALPVPGWTGGWFGRRDRALLVLAATGPPYPAIAALTAGHITIHHHAVTVAAGGQLIEITGVEDPTVCRACALATWIRALSLDVGRGTRALADALKRATELTANSPHRHVTFPECESVTGGSPPAINTPKRSTMRSPRPAANRSSSTTPPGNWPAGPNLNEHSPSLAAAATSSSSPSSTGSAYLWNTSSTCPTISTPAALT